MGGVGGFEDWEEGLLAILLVDLPDQGHQSITNIAYANANVLELPGRPHPPMGYTNPILQNTLDDLPGLSHNFSNSLWHIMLGARQPRG